MMMLVLTWTRFWSASSFWEIRDSQGGRARGGKLRRQWAGLGGLAPRPVSEISRRFSSSSSSGFSLSLVSAPCTIRLLKVARAS